MKIAIPKVLRPVHLADYDEAYGDETVWMWVNPPRATKLKFYEMAEEFARIRSQVTELVENDGGEGDSQKAEALPPLFARLEELGGELYAWWAEMWSQHQDEESHWTQEEVTELVTAALDADPGFWDFLQESSLDAMQEYREQKKRN